ncbi:MAG TPA: tRNA guanosine(34) transglycosylase Tgt [Bacteroidetes bacterium]|nr:tRNA guanosine(34) transglycosylase Tgt [Bacteroidota bacterium]
MFFTITSRDKTTKARAGIIRTDHGEIRTPAFMPVGTAGSVKAVSQQQLEQEVKASIILGNAYHLYLRPGLLVLEKSRGLHRFMNWKHPILTDSGGYQVFSLTNTRQLAEEGVWFRSHFDGSKHLFSPEKVVDIQRVIGSDIMMALDECTPYPCTYEYAKDSLALTHRWLERGWQHFLESKPLYGHDQVFFPIVQGSVYPDLRETSARTIASYDAEGYAIGGLSVGEPVEDMYNMVDLVCDILPECKPRYLMGVGTPVNILESIARGVDMFDCVMPTRNARNGMIFTHQGIINIKNLQWKEDFSPIDPLGPSLYSRTYTKAYLRHLILSKEILGAQIATIHNLSFYIWLINRAREKIVQGEFGEWKMEIIEKIGKRLAQA